MHADPTPPAEATGVVPLDRKSLARAFLDENEIGEYLAHRQADEGAPDGDSALPAGPPLQSVERRDFELALHGCSRRDGEVRCMLVAVNRRDGERNLLLEGSSRVVLADGRALRTRRVTAGGWWATGELSRVGTGLLPGVPVTMGAVFAGVPEGVQRIDRLVFDFYGLEVAFGEVPID